MIKSIKDLKNKERKRIKDKKLFWEEGKSPEELDDGKNKKLRRYIN